MKICNLLTFDMLVFDNAWDQYPRHQIRPLRLYNTLLHQLNGILTVFPLCPSLNYYLSQHWAQTRQLPFGTIHILRKHFFTHHNIFMNLLSNLFLPYLLKILNFSIFCQNVMLKNEFFCFDKKNTSFCEKLGSQNKFCAIQVLT